MTRRPGPSALDEALRTATAAAAGAEVRSYVQHRLCNGSVLAEASYAADLLAALAADVRGRPAPSGYVVVDPGARVWLAGRADRVAEHVSEARRHLRECRALLAGGRHPEASRSAMVAATMLLEAARACGHPDPEVEAWRAGMEALAA